MIVSGLGVGEAPADVENEVGFEEVVDVALVGDVVVRGDVVEEELERPVLLLATGVAEGDLTDELAMDAGLLVVEVLIPTGDDPGLEVLVFREVDENTTELVDDERPAVVEAIEPLLFSVEV